MPMTQTTLHTLAAMKQSGEKITCLTAYDATHASLISNNGAEVILVGDSLGMVCQGHSSTVPVSMDDMIYHTRCVSHGNQGSLLMADMPFMGCGTEEQAMLNSAALMQAGAEVIKLEGGSWLCPTVQKLSERGIPTCLHLGLTPQTVSMLGGYKVQGKDNDSANQIIQDACLLEQAGANILLVECVPTQLAQKITMAVNIPVIGIGAGPDTDGQILVLYDILDMTAGHRPRFVKNFMAETASPQEAITAFVSDVKAGRFPRPEHGFHSK